MSSCVCLLYIRHILFLFLFKNGIFIRQKTIYHQETGVVAYPKYNYPKWIDNFTIDLGFNYYDGMGTHFSQVEQKIRKEKRNDDEPIYSSQRRPLQ